jgi:hypothetical protein
MMVESHEFVLFKFKEGTPYPEQLEAMKALEPIVSEFEGYVSRSYFYDEEQGGWLDHGVWASIEQAKKASELVIQNPEAQAIFGKMDESTMLFGHYTEKS